MIIRACLGTQFVPVAKYTEIDLVGSYIVKQFIIVLMLQIDWICSIETAVVYRSMLDLILNQFNK